MDAINLTDFLTPKLVPDARFVVMYESRNITRDISASLLSLRYTDYLSGQSDDLDIQLVDAQGRWRGDWYPGHGDTLTLSMGWHGTPLRAVGSFEIDEVELQYPPSVVNIRALATGIRAGLRTVENRAYEGMTLEGVAKQIAQRQGLELVGRIESIKLDRLTQRESDLVFLRELADTYDYAFKVVGSKLVFHSISELAQGKPIGSLALTQLTNVRIRDQLREVPRAVEVKHQEPAKKQLVEYRIENGKTVAVPSSASKTTSSGDTRKSRKRAASAEEATAQAKADLAKSNRERATGGWSCVGRPSMVSGNVLALIGEDAGKFAGNYLITRSTHTVDRNGGYVTDVDACRVSTDAQTADDARLGIQSVAHGKV
ncbi:phage late control D family protein [Pseudomonas aeruginosa]|uniref:phage late control D family protein n=1 Tax=Pseudomonas sp. NBRC 111143 TaxID=1661058 RepID=UPI000A48C445|nr:late control protein D [Pseudomonas sp. NBRC 111143]